MHEFYWHLESFLDVTKIFPHDPDELQFVSLLCSGIQVVEYCNDN